MLVELEHERQVNFHIPVQMPETWHEVDYSMLNLQAQHRWGSLVGYMYHTSPGSHPIEELVSQLALVACFGRTAVLG